MAVVPLIFTTWVGTIWSPVTAEQFDLPKLVAMEILVLAGIGAWLWSAVYHSRDLRRGPGDWWVLVVLGWLAVTVVLAIHFPTALLGKYRRYDGFVTYAFYAGVFFLGMQAFTGQGRLRSLTRTLVLAGVVIALYGILQNVGLDPVRWSISPFERDRAFSTMGNPNLLGGYLIFPMVLAAVMALSARGFAARLFYWAAGLVCAAALLVTFTRGSWIAALVALVLLALVMVRFRERPEKADVVPLLLGGALVVAVAIRSAISGRSVTNLVERVVSLADLGSGSMAQRIEIWKSAAAAVADRPVFGFGLDSFRLVFPTYKTEDYIAISGRSNVADNAHNYLLQLGVGAGVVGALLVFGFFAWVLYRSARRILSSRSSDRLLFAGYWVAVAGYLVHLAFGISVVGSSTLLWLSLGILLASDGWSQELAVPKAFRRATPAVVATLGALAVLSFSQVIADYHFVRAQNPALPLERQADRLLAARSYNPLEGTYRLELARSYGTALHRLLLRASVDAEGRDLYLETAGDVYADAVEAYQESIDFSSWEADNYLGLSATHNQAGISLYPSAFESAFAVAQEGIDRAPLNPEVRLEAGFAAINTDRVDVAIEHLSTAVELDPSYAEAAAVLGDAYAVSGDLESARSSYARAVEVEPGNERYQEALARVEADIEGQAAGEDSVG